MSELVNRRGVAAAEHTILGLPWFYREQFVSDQGVDAIVEAVDVSVVDGRTREEGTGRLLAVQVKSGDSWFERPSADGWWFYFDGAHSRRWLNVALPAVVVLVQPDTLECFWQELSPATMQSAGAGFKVNVPASNRVGDANEAWRVLASAAAAEAPFRWDESLSRLPPSSGNHLKRLAESSSLDAALLAMHLAEGRMSPQSTVAALLTAKPVWLTRGGSKAWVAVGTYAAAHDLHTEAADCLVLAADAAPDSDTSRGRWLAHAAMHLVYSDGERSAALTEQAAAMGAEQPFVSVLRAVLTHPDGDAAPIPVPTDLDVESEEVRGSAFVQSFLAISAQRRGDHDAALRHSALAVGAEPLDVSVLEHRADVLALASASGHGDMDFPAEVVRLLQEVVEQRRQWDGPTLNASLDLARTAMLTGQFHVALNCCLPAPEGTADLQVAGNSRARRLALAAAAALDRLDLAERIASEMGEDTADRLAQVRVGLLKMTTEEVAACLHADLDDALAAGDNLRAVQDALELAGLGVDASAALRPLVERSIVGADTAELVAAAAAAKSDFDRALPTLRRLGRTNRQAAALLVELLKDAGRFDEALAMCEMGLSVRREPAAVIARAQLMIAKGDARAETTALEAAAEVGGFAPSRRGLLAFAAQKASTRDDWDLAVRRLGDAVAIPGPVPPRMVWWLVAAQLHMGRLSDAQYTVGKHSPHVDTVEEAELWVQAHAATRLNATQAAEALALAERFNHPTISTSLLGLIISGTDGADPDGAAEEDDPECLVERRRTALTAVPAELHRRAFEALNRLVEEHGASTGVVVIKGEDEDLVAQLTEILKATSERDKVLADYAKQAQESTSPIGLVSTLAGKGYATTLVQRALGLLPAGSADDDEMSLEVDVAANALDTEVVADASALLTACGPARNVDTSFSIVTITPATLRDIHRAQADVRGSASSPGSLYFDTEAEAPAVTTLGSDEFLRRLKRVEDLLALASRLMIRTPTARSVWGERASGVPIGAWADAVELAHERDLALWSDDLGLRRAARAAGVRCFGTPALLVALNERAADGASEADLEALADKAAEQNRLLAADMVVDVPLRLGDLTRLAEDEGWEPGGATLALSRPSWWAWQVQNLEELAPLFSTLRNQKPEAIGYWQSAAMTGAGRAFVDRNVGARMVGSIALFGWDNSDPHSHVRAGLERARAVAAALALPDPIGTIGARAGGSAKADQISAVVSAVLEELRSLPESGS